MRSLQVKFDGVVKMLKRSIPLSSGKLHHYEYCVTGLIHQTWGSKFSSLQ